MLNKSKANPFGAISHLCEAVAPLLKSTGSQQFPTLLALALERLVPYDSLIITRFGDQPVVEHIRYPLKSFSDDAHSYASAAYLLDPFYRAAVDSGASGFTTLSYLAPDGFLESEYYKLYYGKTRLGDECGYLIHLANGDFLNIGLCRLIKNSHFLHKETELLKASSPLIENLCQIHWDTIADQDVGGGKLNRQLELALASFGASKLTPRESEIVQLLLHGHSTQSLADKLKISAETVKIHRRNSYEKLDINSQSELFNLFLTALQSFDVYQGGDPLEGFY